MTDPTSTTRQHDPALCPSWCSREHVGQAPDTGGFHHDGEQWAMLPASTDDGYVFVNVAQYVPDEGDPWPVVVEVQDDRHTVARLTPEEADLLGQALLDAAAKAAGR